MIFFALLSFFIIIFSPSESQMSSEERYMGVMASTAEKFRDEGGEAIWPHFDLMDPPILFHFPNGHAYAYGLKSPSPLWEEEKTLHGSVLFCEDFPAILPPFQPSYLLEGEKTFVMQLDEGKDDFFLPLLTFIHERFHITQFHAFARERVTEPMLGDYQDIDHLTWMEIEHRLLTTFLQTDQSAIKLECLKDYLAISHHRRSSLHPHTIRWEDHQQKMEGLADYVSVKTFQVIPTIENFNPEEFLLKMRQKKRKGIVNTQDALKGRHYFVGAVLGWALDFCDVKNWKESIASGGISLQDMLEKTLNVAQEEIEKRFFQLHKSFDWNAIHLQIEQQMGKEQKDNEEVLKTFTEQEGIVVHMGTPYGPMSSGGSHQKMFQINRTKVLTRDTSQAMSRDQMWKLSFHAIPFVFEEQNGDRTFKLDAQTLLFIDGEQSSLAEIFEKDLKERFFYSLSLKHEHCELDSQRPGKVYVKKGRVFFEFK